MTRLGGLDGDFCRLEIADLTDHDDVRILAEKGAHRRSERESDLCVDVYLVNAREVDFSRVLRRGDICVLAVEDVETGVQGDGLAAAGGPVTRIMPWGLPQEFHVQVFLERLVAERVDAEHRLRRVENTADDLLAEQRRTRAHAEVDGAILRELHLDTAVLGDAPLGDVEPRHDLQTSGELTGQLHRRLRDFLQHTVHAQPHAIDLFVGLRNGCRTPRDEWHPA